MKRVNASCQGSRFTMCERLLLHGGHFASTETPEFGSSDARGAHRDIPDQHHLPILRYSVRVLAWLRRHIIIWWQLCLYTLGVYGLRDTLPSDLAWISNDLFNVSSRHSEECDFPQTRSAVASVCCSGRILQTLSMDSDHLICVQVPAQCPCEHVAQEFSCCRKELLQSDYHCTR